MAPAAKCGRLTRWASIRQKDVEQCEDRTKMPKSAAVCGVKKNPQLFG
jgi:hypothetical protein